MIYKLCKRITSHTYCYYSNPAVRFQAFAFLPGFPGKMFENTAEKCKSGKNSLDFIPRRGYNSLVWNVCDNIPYISNVGWFGTSDMIDIILHEPEIPMNTGNIARTCACTGARLHLIKPLGFDISDKAVKRAGLDYWQYVDISVYEDLDDFFAKNGDENLWLATTKAPRGYADAPLLGDVKLMFGKETAGLPEWLREKYRDRCIRIPMIGPVRSLNLANSVAVLCYEALRQQGFPNLKSTGSMLEEL